MDDATSFPGNTEYAGPIVKRGLGKVVGALIATLVVVALLLVHVWSRYRVISLGYELSELTTEREQLLEENRRLRIEQRVLTRTDRLEPLARRQLGLISPAPENIFYVRASELALPNFAPIAPPQTPLTPAPAPSSDIHGPMADGSIYHE